MLSVLCLTIGFAGGMLYYNSQMGSLQQQIGVKDGQIGRYRVALRIDKASEGSLIELNNAELQAMALNVAGNLQGICSTYQKKIQGIQTDFNAGKYNEKEKMDRQMAVDKELSENFFRDLRADSFNVDNELRRRLGPQAVAAIVGITPSMVADDGTRVDLLTLLFSSGGMPGFNMDFTCTLGGGIEQMAKLLPPDSAKP